MTPLFFGGSFNPVHHGHLICARAAAEAGGFDRVVLVPTGQPPHKPGAADLAPAGDRLKMCELAVSGSRLFRVEEIETRRQGPSYTIETVQMLAERRIGKINWLIGADMLLYLPHWHRVSELLNQVTFVVMARPGSVIDWEALPPNIRQLEERVVPAPMLEISATEIRRRVAAGLSIDYLTPPAVCRYIRDRGLYRSGVT
jgi:nicotinate-nucleotide adenylyltransferase